MKCLRILLILTMTVGFLTAGATGADAIGVFAEWQDSKDANSGFGLGVGHKFQIIPIVAAEARVSWIRYDGGLDMFPLEALGRAKLGLFYAGAGIGYYIFSADFAPKNTVGGFLMGGGEFTLLGLGAFAELRYLFLEPDNDDIIGGKIDMGGFGALVGVILPFF